MKKNYDIILAVFAFLLLISILIGCGINEIYKEKEFNNTYINSSIIFGSIKGKVIDTDYRSESILVLIDGTRITIKLYPNKQSVIANTLTEENLK